MTLGESKHNPAQFNRIFSFQYQQNSVIPTQSFTQIPVGQIALEYQKAAQAAAQQLDLRRGRGGLLQHRCQIQE